jgi:hypothetical protein
MKPGYQGSDSCREFAERTMGAAEMRAASDRPQAYKKGGHVKAKCMAMGGAGKIRHNEATKKGGRKG